MNKKILTLATLLAIAPGISMSASVYKWTDENGVTHFGDRQPTGKSAERLNVRAGVPASAASKKASPQERLTEMEKEKEKESLTARERAEMEAREKQRVANCETARTNLKVIDSNARVHVEEDGERRYLSPEEIAEQRQKFQQVANENCGPAQATAAN
ncbi:DUF4124 domain-containing protein [Marinobacter salinisoli]|uniref:DUF4124 domain-containing protein n=1 Tax=Marinobacter salinisoli TaxID=2769486 RepID=A0ABX7MV10_9GAMM|nr:DUF4124 domain-containing protein [Marinobacter salinisoli]QSP96136.1 DUF4124 domain-containing protein [Marinobacter salinisoli]